MAVLRQQASFVGQLYSSGVIEEAEQEMMLDPIERKVSHLVTPTVNLQKITSQAAL